MSCAVRSVWLNSLDAKAFRKASDPERARHDNAGLVMTEGPASKRSTNRPRSERVVSVRRNGNVLDRLLEPLSADATVARTDDPRVLNKDTHSGASVKADKHSKDPKTLQKEHANSVNNQSGSGKVTASPNDVPTDSEDSVHGEKHSKSPEQLQKEHTGN
ncbi:hypothetical protein PHSY_005462 [Pseudozyma hubeiensis SY62]|uniref:Uncharacterized protein n=1 Tax=Pseudozyma hubeiensis (strain SY62) TaxID=1305764 RepID=R9P962_PSEHS|nr:hypothetical protein PHSY_005462 [Pseudozyma hubeiensis SY62]GAC97874.1 hypothetical protein PHSY_005462 [Pseudozyma hubeiensis SY62]